MQISVSSASARLRRTPLAACLGALLALGAVAPIASAATNSSRLFPKRGDTEPLLEALRSRAAATKSVAHSSAKPQGGLILPVTSCADDGSAGTLRHVVLTASSGDTVDLSGLTCSTITLESGAVDIDVDDLTILGPGAAALAIDGNNAGRVFRHGGTGTLGLSYLTVTHGSYTSIASMYGGGGCIYTKGTVDLTGVIVSSCAAMNDTVVTGGAILSLGGIVMDGSAIKDSSAIALSGTTGLGAAGGAAVALYQIVLQHSTVSGNSVTTPLGDAYAGGLFAGGTFTAKYSTVTGNSATTTNAPGSTYYAWAGGLFARSTILIEYTTIDNNSADAFAGGYLHPNDPTYATTIRNSTISSNHATLEGGGLFVGGNLTLENSTIAFNTAGDFGGGGLIAGGDTADLESNIIADNSPSGSTFAADLDGSAVITGAHNIIKIAGATLTLPPDTITQDPQLGPLAYNGGETRTHAITTGSPALDAGNNLAGESYDQRGPGYLRVYGANPDIGAYEFNPDIIFVDGFDTGG